MATFRECTARRDQEGGSERTSLLSRSLNRGRRGFCFSEGTLSGDKESRADCVQSARNLISFGGAYVKPGVGYDG